MSSTGSTYGDIHRYEPARESTAAAIAIVLLTVIEVLFVFLFTYGLISGWALTDTGNMFLGGILAVVFVVHWSLPGRRGRLPRRALSKRARER